MHENVWFRFRISLRMQVKVTRSSGPRYTLCMHLSMYCPPPLGRKWGFTGGIDTKLLPHYGAFDDRSVSVQIFFVVFKLPSLCQIPRCNWGQRWGFDTIGLPYYGAFDIRLCQIPTIAHICPRGGGGGSGAIHCSTFRGGSRSWQGEGHKKPSCK